MVYKTFKINSNKISINSSYTLPKEELKDLIPFFKFEGHYGGKVDGLEDTIGVFLTPTIYFPASSKGQIPDFNNFNKYVDVKIKKSDIENYFNQVSDLEEIFEADLTVGSYVTNRNWVLQEDRCKFLGISDDRINIEILINEIPVNVYFRTDVNIRIFKKDDVIEHLLELSMNPNQLFHIELNRADFKVKDKFGDIMAENIDWTEFYMEFADKLLNYKNNRTQLIQKIQKVYEKININLPTLEKDIDRNTIIPYDIDPFTIFALFNKGITDENRIKIVNGIKEEFSIKADIPTSFFGIPVVNNLSATFYFFTGNRGEEDIDNLWEVFESALYYSKDFNEESRENFISYYNKVIKQKGIKWNITMGLYWIRPTVFINLVSSKRKFLSNESNFPQDIVDEAKILKYGPPIAEKYLKLCDLLYSYLKESEFKNFVELSNYAYFYEKDKEDSSPSTKGIGDGDVKSIHYWICSPGEGATMWDEWYDDGIIAIGWGYIGDLRNYSNKEDIRTKLQKIENSDSKFFNAVNALWQFANDIKEGDIIFAKKGTTEIVGRGIVVSDYNFDEGKGHYPHIRKVKWTHKGNWAYEFDGKKLHQKTLTDITNQKDKVENINNLLYVEGDIVEEPPITSTEYTIEKFLEEVYISEEDYSTLNDLLINKKNIIVQGAPGVGKTFMAKRLAYSIMGVKDVDRVMMVQFHQSYSY